MLNAGEFDSLFVVGFEFIGLSLCSAGERERKFTAQILDKPPEPSGDDDKKDKKPEKSPLVIPKAMVAVSHRQTPALAIAHNTVKSPTKATQISIVLCSDWKTICNEIDVSFGGNGITALAAIGSTGSRVLAAVNDDRGFFVAYDCDTGHFLWNVELPGLSGRGPRALVPIPETPFVAVCNASAGAVSFLDVERQPKPIELAGHKVLAADLTHQPDGDGFLPFEEPVGCAIVRRGPQGPKTLMVLQHSKKYSKLSEWSLGDLCYHHEGGSDKKPALLSEIPLKGVIEPFNESAGAETTSCEDPRPIAALSNRHFAILSPAQKSVAVFEWDPASETWYSRVTFRHDSWINAGALAALPRSAVPKSGSDGADKSSSDGGTKLLGVLAETFPEEDKRPPNSDLHPERINAALALQCLLATGDDDESNNTTASASAAADLSSSEPSVGAFYRPKRNFTVLPFVDCIDALLRPSVLAVCMYRSSQVVLFNVQDLTVKAVFDMIGDDGAIGIREARWITHCRANGRPALAVAYQGTRGARGGEDGVAIFHVQDWTHPVRTIRAREHGGKYLHSVVALRHPEQIAVSGCQSMNVIAFDCSDGHRLWIAAHPGWWPTNMTLCPDGMLAVCDYDQGAMYIINPDQEGAVVDRWISKFGLHTDDEDPPEGLAKQENPTFWKPSMCSFVKRETYLPPTLFVADDDFAYSCEERSYPSGDRLSGFSLKGLTLSECGGVVQVSKDRLLVMSQGDDTMTFVDDDGNGGWKATSTLRHPLFKRPLGFAYVALPDNAAPYDLAEARITATPYAESSSSSSSGSASDDGF